MPELLFMASNQGGGWEILLVYLAFVAAIVLITGLVNRR